MTDITKASAISPERREELEQRAISFVSEILQSRQDTVNAGDRVRSMGLQAQRRSSSLSSELLDRPMRQAKEGGYEKQVQGSLQELRTTIEELDPNKQSGMQWAKRIPLIGKLVRKGESSLQRYQSAQQQIDSILESLYRGQDNLRRDNASISQTINELEKSIEELSENIELAQVVDEQLTARIEQLEQQDPERARVAREEVLFVVRQRRTDLGTQLAVTMQGVLALKVVRGNNKELIAGVERATTTTVSALRVAVVVSQALDSQKGVLDQITAMNQTTGNMIEKTARQLREQSGEIQRQAASATIDPEQIARSFAEVRKTLDEISEIRATASEKLRVESLKLEEQTREARKVLDREKLAGEHARQLMQESQAAAAKPKDVLDLS